MMATENLRDILADMEVPAADALCNELAEIDFAFEGIKFCEWDETDADHGVWSTLCGIDWACPAGTPKRNGMKYCTNCGKRIRYI